MDFVVKNAPSPGASMTLHTDNSILAYYELCQDFSDKYATFAELRADIAAIKHTNPKNDRTIFPLLKNLGFVSYEKQVPLSYKDFFTNDGLQYIRVLQLEKTLPLATAFTEAQKVAALKKAKLLKEELLFKGLMSALLNHASDMTYRDGLLTIIAFLLRYNSYDKPEFAYAIYCMDNNIAISEADQIVHAYRNQKIDLTFKVDAYVKKHGADVRTISDDTSKFTCYTYLSGLLIATAIVRKDAQKHNVLNEERRADLEYLLRERC